MSTLISSPTARLTAQTRGFGDTRVLRKPGARTVVVVPGRRPRAKARQAAAAVFFEPNHVVSQGGRPRKPIANHFRPAVEPEKPISEADHLTPMMLSDPASKKRLKLALWRQRRKAVKRKLGPVLRKEFPDVFCDPPVPLDVGIIRILEAVTEFERSELNIFLNDWTGQPAYHEAVLRGEFRRDLNGDVIRAPNGKHRARAARKRGRLIGHRPAPAGS